jgi:hypothetical protein
MICGSASIGKLTHRWRELDSKFQFRATVGGFAGLRDTRSGQSSGSHRSSFRSTAVRTWIRLPVDRLRFQGFVACLQRSPPHGWPTSNRNGRDQIGIGGRLAPESAEISPVSLSGVVPVALKSPAKQLARHCGCRFHFDRDALNPEQPCLFCSADLDNLKHSDDFATDHPDFPEVGYASKFCRSAIENVTGLT